MPAGTSAIAAAAREARCPIPPSPDGVSTFGSLYGGFQAGYNHRVSVRISASASKATFRSRSSSRTAPCRGGRRRSTPTSSDQVDYVATLRARFGYVFGNTMVYGTGGFATALTRFLEDPWPRPSPGQGPAPARRLVGRRRRRVRARAGLDRADRISLRPLRRRVGRASRPAPPRPPSFDLHTVRLGLNHFFHPGECGRAAARRRARRARGRSRRRTGTCTASSR